jgi:hypothetical protein
MASLTPYDPRTHPFCLMDGRVIGEPSDAVLWTAMPRHDEGGNRKRALSHHLIDIDLKLRQRGAAEGIGQRHIGGIAAPAIEARRLRDESYGVT